MPNWFTRLGAVLGAAETKAATTMLSVPPWAEATVTSKQVSANDNERINEANRRIHAEQWKSGTSFISRTQLGHTVYGSEPPVVVLRAVLANPLTRFEDIDAVLAEQAALGKRLAAVTSA